MGDGLLRVFFFRREQEILKGCRVGGRVKEKKETFLSECDGGWQR